jgi:hypothetical protein
VDKHITILGVLHIANSAIGIIAAVIVFTVVTGAGIISGDPEAMTITAIVGSSVALFLLVLSLPGLIGGVGLLQHRQWARILVLVVGFLNLLNIPLGTALGVYTIWVLLKQDTIPFFNGRDTGTTGVPTT